MNPVDPRAGFINARISHRVRRPSSIDRARRTSTSESFFSSFTLNSEYPAGVSNNSNMVVGSRRARTGGGGDATGRGGARADRPTDRPSFCVMGVHGYTGRDECPNCVFNGMTPPDAVGRMV